MDRLIFLTFTCIQKLQNRQRGTPFLTNHCNTICEGRVEDPNLTRSIGNFIRVNTDTHTLNLLHKMRAPHGQKSSKHTSSTSPTNMYCLPQNLLGNPVKNKQLLRHHWTFTISSSRSGTTITKNTPIKSTHAVDVVSSLPPNAMGHPFCGGNLCANLHFLLC